MHACSTPRWMPKVCQESCTQCGTLVLPALHILRYRQAPAPKCYVCDSTVLSETDMTHRTWPNIPGEVELHTCTSSRVQGRVHCAVRIILLIALQALPLWVALQCRPCSSQDDF